MLHQPTHTLTVSRFNGARVHDGITRGDKVRICDKTLLWAVPSLNREYTVVQVLSQSDGIYAVLDHTNPMTGRPLCFGISIGFPIKLAKVEG